MANGLLGLGSFAEGAQDAYWKQKQYDLALQNQENERKQLAAHLAAQGFETDEQGNLRRTAEGKKDRAYQRAIEQAKLLKVGSGIGNYNPETESYEIKKVPGFRDLEEENKSLHNQVLRTQLKEGKKPSAGEFAASGYAKRLEDAEGVFNDLNAKGYDPAGPSSTLQKSALFPDMLQGENVKREEQAKRNFVNALLRRESGAAISSGEFESANKQYFPQPGDTPAVLKQKEVNRRLAFEGIKAEGARAYTKSPGVQEVKGMLGSAPESAAPEGLLGGLASAAKGLLGSPSAVASPPVDKVASFMQKNGIKDRNEAIAILKQHGKL